ncbi:MAG: hypothetical protein M1434_01795 [Chloroflexi bacterium]|nr:hypothetical protein [Chloroflexota bacterium]
MIPAGSVASTDQTQAATPSLPATCAGTPGIDAVRVSVAVDRSISKVQTAPGCDLIVSVAAPPGTTCRDIICTAIPPLTYSAVGGTSPFSGPAPIGVRGGRGMLVGG